MLPEDLPDVLLARAVGEACNQAGELRPLAAPSEQPDRVGDYGGGGLIEARWDWLRSTSGGRAGRFRGRRRARRWLHGLLYGQRDEPLKVLGAKQVGQEPHQLEGLAEALVAERVGRWCCGQSWILA